MGWGGGGSDRLNGSQMDRKRRLHFQVAGGGDGGGSDFFLAGRPTSPSEGTWRSRNVNRAARGERREHV